MTGGAGYVGSHACKALAQSGYTPVCYDNLVNGHRWAVKWGPFERGDISDRSRLEAVISHYRPVAVLHFAAFAYVGESIHYPEKYYRNNVAGTLTLLEAMCVNQIKQIVFSSTCSTYGIPLSIPINEDHIQNPINPYGASKLMVERLLRDFEMAHGVRSISLRYFNAAGADPDSEIGEAHNPETHLIPLVLSVADRKFPKITIFGENYQTHDGTCVRDYVHVSDLADAHVLALKAISADADTTAYNLGIGNGFSVKDVVTLAEKITGVQIPVEIGPPRLGDPPRLVSDSSRIRKALGWTPRYSSLESIISTAWKWQKNRGMPA